MGAEGGEIRSPIIFASQNFCDPDSVTSTRFACLVYRLCLSHLVPLPITNLIEMYSMRFVIAEGGRFELPRPFSLAVFKTARFNHSRTPPVRYAESFDSTRRGAARATERYAMLSACDFWVSTMGRSVWVWR